MRLAQLSAVCAALLLPTVAHAQDRGSSPMFLDFVRRQAAELRAQDKLPATRAEWEERRAALRERIQEAWGGFPATPCPLQPRLIGTLRRYTPHWPSRGRPTAWQGPATTFGSSLAPARRRSSKNSDDLALASSDSSAASRCAMPPGPRRRALEMPGVGGYTGGERNDRQ